MGPGLAALQEAGCPEGQHQGLAHGSWAGPEQCPGKGFPGLPRPRPRRWKLHREAPGINWSRPRRGWEGLRERHGQPSLESLLSSPLLFPTPSEAGK